MANMSIRIDGIPRDSVILIAMLRESEQARPSTSPAEFALLRGGFVDGPKVLRPATKL